MGRCSGLSPKPAGSAWPICSTRPGGAPRAPGAAAASDPRGVRRDVAPPAPAFRPGDDPGAGKTIMAGLFIKELMLRGDLRRCLIVAPGGLVGHGRTSWRRSSGCVRDPDPRHDRGQPIADPFAENDLLIARLDHLSRNDDLVARLGAPSGTSWLSTRRTACRPTTSAARSRRPSATGSARCSAGRPSLAAHDGDSPRRQGGGLPAVPGAARPRPLRGRQPGGVSPPTRT